MIRSGGSPGAKDQKRAGQNKKAPPGFPGGAFMIVVQVGFFFFLSLADLAASDSPAA